MLNKRKKLISLIFNTGRAMKEHFESQKDAPLSMLYIETLGYVVEHGTPSMKHIAEHLCITPASTSSLADNLVEEGLLVRVSEKNDRRLVKLKITKKGSALLKKSLKHANEQMSEVFSQMDEKEVEVFIKILERFIEIINKKKEKK